MEAKSLYSPKQFLEILRKDIEKKANRKPLKIGAVQKFERKTSKPEIKLSKDALIEKLRSFARLSKEEFEGLFKLKAEESVEFFKYIGVHLPLMTNELLIYALDFANAEIEKHWAFRARCVAEAFKRCPKLSGGRYKKAKDNEGREKLVELLAEKFNTSKTNIRVDERIMRIFGNFYEIETSAESAEVSPILEKEEFIVARSSDNNFFTDYAVVSEKKPNTIKVHSFTPHPKLEREHYAVATRLDQYYAKEAIDFAIAEIEAGRTYTAADMERKLFPRKSERPGYFKLHYPNYPNSIVKIEVSFDELDKEILCKALGKELGIEPQKVMSAVGANILSDKGFECFMGILKKYIESN